jgi:hypothetical protein
MQILLCTLQIVLDSGTVTNVRQMQFTLSILSLALTITQVSAINCWIGFVVGNSAGGLIKSETVPGAFPDPYH